MTTIATRANLLLASILLLHGVTTTAAEPNIHTEDVARFFKIYDAAAGKPTAEQLQSDYLGNGSEGLKTLSKLRNVTGAGIAEMVNRNPAMYANARHCAEALPKVHQRLTAALNKLFELYPEARSPAVTIAMGRGKPVGVGYPSSGVQIGLEALCAANFMNPDIEDRFVFVIAHEYVHVQQNVALTEGKRPTVLEVSLLEGIADFVGELISGGVSLAHLTDLTRGREKEIETAFLADIDNTDLSGWVYNSTYEKPSDLGYWVGYRIAKAYYRQATDKRQALRDMLQTTDARAFLARSGWQPE